MKSAFEDDAEQLGVSAGRLALSCVMARKDPSLLRALIRVQGGSFPEEPAPMVGDRSVEVAQLQAALGREQEAVARERALREQAEASVRDLEARLAAAEADRDRWAASVSGRLVVDATAEEAGIPVLAPGSRVADVVFEMTQGAKPQTAAAFVFETQLRERLSQLGIPDPAAAIAGAERQRLVYRNGPKLALTTGGRAVVRPGVRP